MAEPLSLYIHIPFCVRKCRYCDFPSAPASESTREHYLDLLLREIRIRGRQYAGRPVDTVYFGGGTPSILTPLQLERIFNAFHTSFRICPEAEISLEANPGTIGEEGLSAFRSIGVNRLSVGVQSFLDHELAVLGRIHTAAQARECLDAAKRAGFTNVSLDLINQLPGQRADEFAVSLREAVLTGVTHISVYNLIIEEGTPFGEYYGENAGNHDDPGRISGIFGPGGLPPLPDEDEQARIDELTGSFLENAGFFRYEISNYAKDGAVCRHNEGYWTNHDYLGMGLSAASKTGHTRFRNPDDPAAYEKAVSLDMEPVREMVQELSVRDEMEEFFFLGLRRTDGVSEDRFRERFGRTADEVYGSVLAAQQELGTLRREDGRIFLTKRGMEVSNRVMAEFLF